MNKDPGNSRMSLLAHIQYFPFTTNRISFHTGIGAGNYFFTPQRAITTSDGHRTLGSVVGKGFACMAGAGYEFQVGKMLTLSPVVNINLCFPGDLKVNDIFRIDNDTASVLLDSGVVFRLNQ